MPIYKVLVQTERVVTIKAETSEQAYEFAWENVGGEAFLDNPGITSVDIIGEAEDQTEPAEYKALERGLE